MNALAVLLSGGVASGSADGNVRVWDMRARACTVVLRHYEPVYSLAALPCGGIAAGCMGGTIALWSAAGVRTATLGGWRGGGRSFGSAFSLALLPDSRLAAGCYHPHVICVWDVERCALDVVISGHTGGVCALVALPDRRLLSGSNDRALKVWGEAVLSVRGGEGANTCEETLLGHTQEVKALTVLPDGLVASGGRDGTVRVRR